MKLINNAIKSLGGVKIDQREDRWSKDQVFMKVALTVAQRSPDMQTQVGAVIVTPDYRILSTGYNGFPRDIDYHDLPNTRPDKHDWMMHAETNALSWCEKRPIDCTIYSTHETCNGCIMLAWQMGVTQVVEGLAGTTSMVGEKKKIRDLFILKTGMKVRKMDISQLLDGV